MPWTDIPLDTKLFLNVDETALTRAFAAQENCFVSESNHISRFPGMVDFATLSGNYPVYIDEFRGDMFAVDGSGKSYRITEDGTVNQVEGVQVIGGGRVIFSRTEDRIVMAAGSDIISFAGESTRKLSDSAPRATHVISVDRYLLANDVGSGIFFYCEPGEYTNWPDLNTFAMAASDDKIESMFITPFQEIIIAGQKSIEQFDRVQGGDPPFTRRWGVGETLKEKYTLCFADQALWGLNQNNEFVRMSGQTSAPQTSDINLALEGLSDTSGAWAQELVFFGQRFIVIQFPKAINSYGTKGVTIAYDYRQKKIAELHGWDDNLQLPTRWPGWSIFRIWDRVFVGGSGKIYEMKKGVYTNSGDKQRMLVRTAHFSKTGEMRCNGLRVKLKRGVGSYTENPQIMLRCNRDNRGWGRWVKKSLGKSGNREFVIETGSFGDANSFQFELACDADAQIEIFQIEADLDKIGR